MIRDRRKGVAAMEIKQRLTDIDIRMAALSSHRPLTQGETERLRDEFIIMFTYNSNAIEGNTMSLDETALVLREGVTIDGKALKEHMEKEFELLAIRMVERQLVTRGINSEAVLDAMRSIPRHLFVPDHLRGHAYEDSPLPIGIGQTISQPYIVAYMTEQLETTPGMKILEIGTGSGYQTAVLVTLGCVVYTIELVETLAASAQKAFTCLGLGSINARHGNGYAGWPEEAPFDAIIVTAAPERIPEKLVGQLKNGGRMIVPVGSAYETQYLKVVEKKDGNFIETNLLPVRFVPMVEK